MSICDKIQHIGNTLEDNLNNRGVDCTFGIGTGEQNIYDMAELITKQNLMGIGDANIQIIPNRPYVTSGETIDVTVRLLDGVGNPLINKIITISDGTNSYNGITDKDGIYTLFNQTITTTTTYTVTYGTETKTAKVQLCEFVDYGVTGNHNDVWYRNSGTDNRTVTATGTTLANTTSTRYDLFAYYGQALVIYLFQPPFTVECDIVDYAITGSNRAKLQLYDENTNVQYNVVDGTGHYKIVCDGTTCMTYKNGVKINEESKNIQNARVGFYIQTNCSITYKNFVIY